MHIRAIIITAVLIAGAFAPAVPAYAQDEPSNERTAADQEQQQSLTTKLQIPIPFVATNCQLKDNVGNIVPDSNGKPIPTVCNLTDYIRGVYRLLIGLAALFAVLMLVIGGYQWIVSGGSADKTGAAKKRIFSAVIGLILALLSYVILNAVTPRLVALRLPIIKPVQTVSSDFENTCQTDPTFIEYEKKKNIPEGTLPVWYVQQGPDGSELKYYNRKAAECGRLYNVDGDFDRDEGIGVIGQCRGNFCGNTQACFQGKCIEAVAYGAVTWNKVQVPPFRDYLADVGLYKLCDFGAFVHMLQVNEQSFAFPPDAYRIPLEGLSGFDENCRQFGVYLGYALAVDVDDGYLAEDNRFMLGKDCSVPFANRKDHITLGRLSNSVVDKDQLITIDDLDQSFECNLDLTSLGFADYDGGED